MTLKNLEVAVMKKLPLHVRLKNRMMAPFKLKISTSLSVHL